MQVSLAPQFRSAKSDALWVTNFPWDATAKDLMEKFAQFGADPETAVRRVQIWETGKDVDFVLKMFGFLY